MLLLGHALRYNMPGAAYDPAKAATQRYLDSLKK
jgi:hypothetical protein